MIPTCRKLTFLFFFLLALFQYQIVRADTGPKPTMDFEFAQELPGDPLTIASGILYECDRSDCSDAAPIEEVGPQGFRCEADRCSATAYGFAPFHRIEIEFSDGQTRQSNVFETAGFDSQYTVTVRPDDLLVEAQLGWPFPRTGTILVACLCGLIGLGLVAGLAVFLVRRSRTA
ncbi:MAG TPA: hypothetical protein VK900_10185 [Anaerolineales bacterium]|nr:hypothetical protein [Anaerolineales bacterium]